MKPNFIAVAVLYVLILLEVDVSGVHGKSMREYVQRASVIGQKLIVDASSDVAVTTYIPDLTDVSACLWLKTKETNDGTPISYAISEEFNELILFDTGNLRVYVRGKNGGKSGIAVNDDDWHHLCVTWSSSGGLWNIYDDGHLAASGSGLQSGDAIRGGGVMTLGQEQDSLRGGYDSKQALKGELAFFNMWSRILTDNEIGQLATDCNGETDGDLFAWSLGNLDLGGSVNTLPADICLEWTGDEKLVVDVSSDVAVTTPIPELTDVSACLWLKTKATNDGTPISYAISGEFNELILFDTSNLRFYVRGGNGGKSGIAVNDNDWHHLCVTWSSSGGLWNIYDDGALAASGSGLQSGNVIRGGGVMTLGQEQDSLRGGYDSKQALKGELAYFNMWSRILTDAEIGQLATECNGETEGNLFAWSSGNLDLDGSVGTLPADICLQWSGDEKLVVDESSDVAITTPIPELTDVSACLWLKTKATNDGTPISYAISGEFNELILFDTSNLRVYVRGENGGKSGIAVNDDDWHHLCVTWSSSGGLWNIYNDGALAASGSGLQSGNVIRGGGVMTLGQEQDSLRGGYDSKQALKGELAYFNMWSRILTDAEIGQLAAECHGHTEGDLFAWSSADIDLDGNPEKLPADICPPTTKAPTTTTAAQTTAVKTTGAPTTAAQPTDAPTTAAKTTAALTTAAKTTAALTTAAKTTAALTTAAKTTPAAQTNAAPITDCITPALVNIAVGKSVAQSSTKKTETDAGRAVDGDKNSDLEAGLSCTQTEKEYQPWWKVDLGETRDVYQVIITNRQDCCSFRLKNAEIRVGDSDTFENNTVCGEMLVAKTANQETIVMDCGCGQPLRGRYVIIQLVDKLQMLQLCEVEVMSG
ncbi:uncharacterized protein LOC100374669 [Saccoglossus kowalevskii]|uniref:Uncharacterized protein LOC100374669 n=1 Tax=Saccoglossus kowalevskii TaxID=10224 RepID=A0ABM0GLT5_SACKO|nr:PREDICTED: uncharacterized protein LOC100374669 [Saccoglossus kowalevskii]